MSERDPADRERERGETPHESSSPPVPGEGTPPGGEQAGREVSSEAEGGEPGGAAESEAQPGEELGAVQVPEGHEADVPDDLREEIERLMGRYPEKRSAALPALFAIQRRYGWCTPEGMRQVAAVMGVSAAYVEGVASFYDLFHLEPAGRHQVLVCTNISCWMQGGDELLTSFCEAAGADHHEAAHGGVVNGDGDLYVSGFECLGACDIAPMASIDARYYGPLETADAATAIDQLRAGEEVLPDKALARRPVAGGPEPEPDERIARVEGE
jgi:NADH-quinone oxidoreductase subunit E